MKYIILFIIVLWIIRRVMNVFVLVSDNPKPDKGYAANNPGRFSGKSAQEEGFSDYEEIE